MLDEKTEKEISQKLEAINSESDGVLGNDESETEEVVKETEDAPDEEEEPEVDDSDDGIEVPQEVLKRMTSLGVPHDELEGFSSVDAVNKYLDLIEKSKSTPEKQEKEDTKEPEKQEKPDVFGIKELETTLEKAKEIYADDDPVIQFLEMQLNATKKISDDMQARDLAVQEQQNQAALRDIDAMAKEVGLELSKDELRPILDDVFLLAERADRRGEEYTPKQLVEVAIKLNHADKLEKLKEEGLKAKATGRKFLKKPAKTDMRPAAKEQEFNELSPEERDQKLEEISRKFKEKLREQGEY